MSANKVTMLRIGEFIAKLRKGKGYTQKTLAEKLYVGEKTISKWERGIVAPDIDIIKKLAEVLDTSIEELINGEKKYDNKVESSTINAAKIYFNQAKYRTMKRFIVIIAIMFAIFIGILLINKYYRWNINKFNVPGDFYISGYSFQNNNETKIAISKIIFDDKNAGTEDEIKTAKLNIALYSDDEVICTDSNNYDNIKPLYEILEKYSFVCESEKRINLNNLSIRIEFSNNNELEKKEILLN